MSSGKIAETERASREEALSVFKPIPELTHQRPAYTTSLKQASRLRTLTGALQ